MFFVIGPLFGIVFLIGIFQIKSLMNALVELIKKSSVDYFKCRFLSDCKITLIKNEKNVYDFYNYYYNYSMNENIDFNLMMLTDFIGNILIRLLGFKGTSGILCICPVLSIIWLLNFDFNFKEKEKFDYDFLKILSILFIYIVFLIGIGGSSLLSHQVLIESYLKYKDYLLNMRINKNLSKNPNEKEMNNITLELKLNDENDEKKESKNLLIQKIDNTNDDKSNSLIYIKKNNR